MRTLTPQEAEAMLLDGAWGNTPMTIKNAKDKIMHCINIGHTMRRMALQINKNGGYNGQLLDLDKAQIMGILHDYGCHENRGDMHPYTGYERLISIGVSEDIARACILHGYINGDFNCSAEGENINSDGSLNPNTALKWKNSEASFVMNYLKAATYSIYDKLMNLADLMVAKKNIGLECRLNDLIERKGKHSTSDYHKEQAFALLHEVEKAMGCKMEEVFPEIKENQREFEVERITKGS